MQQRLTVVVETGTVDPVASKKIAELLKVSIPQWLANDLDFEDKAVEITEDDGMFDRDFSVQVFYPALREE